jgi:hypothetical protein
VFSPFVSSPREEAIARLRAGAHATVVNFEALTEEEWSGFQVAHGFLGPLPASFFVPLELGHHALHAWDLGLGDRDAKLDEQSAGILVTQYIFNLFGAMPSSTFPAVQVADYMLHIWDIRWGQGDTTTRLDERSAGTLIPHLFSLWGYTFNRSAAAGASIAYGVRTGGAWGGQWKVVVADSQFVIEAVEDLSEVPAIFHYEDAAEMVLTRFSRIKAAKASGDPDAISSIRSLFSGL